METTRRIRMKRNRGKEENTRKQKGKKAERKLRKDKVNISRIALKPQ